MFRMGGNTAQGIMSGVAPRQGYSNGEIVNPRDLKVSDLGDLTIGQMQDLSKVRGGRSDLSQFLIDFGLDIASRPPSGSIFSTAAQSAKGPYERFQGRKAARAATEADMFSTLFKGAAEAQGDAKAGKGWLEQWKFQQVPVLLSTIERIEAIPEDQRTSDQQRELDAAKINLDNIKAKDPFTDFVLRDEVGGKIFKKIKTQLLEQDQQSDSPKYTGEDDPQLWKDATRKFREEYMAKGGRVGYQAAGPVMGDAVQADQAMPEELGDISYEELRARLPQEVGDEIVRLLANSAEALEDFATIQTEQDIANFNKKYGVNLVLPAEG